MNRRSRDKVVIYREIDYLPRNVRASHDSCSREILISFSLGVQIDLKAFFGKRDLFLFRI